MKGFIGFANLSLGRAVHARLWEVPAEICWMATPSKPITFLGLVMGPVEFPWPHWPMELLPQAYTSLSLSKTSTWKENIKDYLTIFPNTLELYMFCLSTQRQIVCDIMSEAPSLHLIWVWVSTYPSATNLNPHYLELQFTQPLVQSQKEDLHYWLLSLQNMRIY